MIGSWFTREHTTYGRWRRRYKYQGIGDKAICKKDCSRTWTGRTRVGSVQVDEVKIVTLVVEKIVTLVVGNN